MAGHWTGDDVTVVKAGDYGETGTWLVAVGGQRIGSIRPAIRGRTRRYQAYTLNAVRIAAPQRTRRAAVVALVDHWDRQQ